MEELSKKLKDITNVTSLDVPIEFISYRADEWFSGKYRDQDKMDHLLMQFNLISSLGHEPAESKCADIIVDGDKFKFVEVNEGFNVFNVTDPEVEDMYRACQENNGVDYFVFYSAKRNSVVVRKLQMHDKVKFKFRGIISISDMLDNLKASSSPTSYKFLSLNNPEVTK